MFKKYPSVVLLALVIAGIIAADQFRIPGWSFLFLCLVLTIVGIVLLSKNLVSRALLFFGLGLFCFAGYHFSINFYEFGPDHITRIVTEKERCQIFGTVADWPVIKTNRTEVKVEIDSLGREMRQPVKGAILLKITDTTTSLQRGDRVEFQGTIYPLKSQTDPGGFDYARYLNLRGVFGTVYLATLLDVRVDKSRRPGIIGAVDRIRLALTDSFNRNLSPVSAALASGILIGETRNIPLGVYNRFRDSGTLHLLAVSGSNVALVILFIILVLRPFSIKRNHRSIVLILAVFLFALLSYGEPSVVRASLMAVLVLIAAMIERRFDLNQIIATTALIILLIDPAQLFNVGFQLSFVTAWGLIFIVPKVVNRFSEYRNRKWFQWLAVPLIVSIVAQVCSMPLIAYYFDRVPAISVIANLVIVPLVSIAVVGSLFLFVVDLIWPVLGAFVGALLDGILKVVVYFLDLFGGENSTVIATGEISGIFIFLTYAGLLLATLVLLNKMARKVAIAALIIIVNLGLSVSVVRAFNSDNSPQQIWIFNIPGGSAILVSSSISNSPDLILTGLDSREYPIDERIFESSFLALGVARLNRMFVMSAGFGAMDDILRTAQKFHADSIFIDHRLARSFSDVSTRFPDLANIAITDFPEKMAKIDSSGIYPAANELLIRFPEANILVISDKTESDFSHNPDSRPTALILSGSIPELSNLSTMQKFSPIICTNNHQNLTAAISTDSNAEIFNLQTQGPCRLIILSGESNPFSIRPIQ